LKDPPFGTAVDGIYDSMLSFDPERHLKLSAMKIDWKNDKLNLCKKYPRLKGNEDEDDLMEGGGQGSFFTLFGSEDDDMAVRISL
jgi:template-activating factor I